MKSKSLIGALVLLFAVACGSVGLDDLGSILGSQGPADNSAVRGTVIGVDTSARRIDLDVQYVNNLRDDQAGRSIYYDSSTVVEYGGSQYRPEDLERGDEISIEGANQNGRFVATRITVTRDSTR